MNKRIAALIYLFYPIFWGTWLFYLAFMEIKSNKEQYKKALGIAWYGGYPIFAIALLMDILFNFTFGSVFYREFPKEFLFTARCSRHLKGTGIQLARAHFVCVNLLDPADKGHCK
ncbi:MAG: hypothetical protein KAT69_07920 [Candidatus Aminicenantes bacterium]|nr:hypothetical protein [Candidatus Aminicenantes bacterium]